VPTTPPVTRTRRHPFRPVRPAGWWFDLLLLAAAAAITLALANGWLLNLDLAVRDWADSHRPTPLYWTLRAFNFFGQGGPLAIITIGLGAYLGWRRHTIRPVLPGTAAFVLLIAAILPLKTAFDRAAPHADVKHGVVHPERLFSGGDSYPSGHVANTIVWFWVLALLLSPWLPPALRRMIRVVPPLIVVTTTTWLGFHWLSDDIVGLLLGLVLARLMARVDWNAVPLGRPLDRLGWTGPGLPEPPAHRALATSMTPATGRTR